MADEWTVSARALRSRAPKCRAAGHADEEAGEQRHQNGGGADGAQGDGAGVAPHHGDVRHVEQNLQEVGEDQRQAEEKYLLSKGSPGQVSQ